jgi:hypothetical protein
MTNRAERNFLRIRNLNRRVLNDNDALSASDARIPPPVIYEVWWKRKVRSDERHVQCAALPEIRWRYPWSTVMIDTFEALAVTLELKVNVYEGGHRSPIAYVNKINGPRPGKYRLQQ